MGTQYFVSQSPYFPSTGLKKSSKQVERFQSSLWDIQRYFLGYLKLKFHCSPAQAGVSASESGLAFEGNLEQDNAACQKLEVSPELVWWKWQFLWWTSVTSSVRCESSRAPFTCGRTRDFAADKSVEMMWCNAEQDIKGMFKLLVNSWQQEPKLLESKAEMWFQMNWHEQPSCHDIYPWSRANDILARFSVSAKLKVQARLTGTLRELVSDRHLSSAFSNLYSAHTYAVYFISFLYSALPRFSLWSVMDEKPKEKNHSAHGTQTCTYMSAHISVNNHVWWQHEI